MSIPDYQTIMLPLLRFASDGYEHASREPVDFLAAEFEYQKTNGKNCCQAVDLSSQIE
jgi:restriction system protein